MPKLIDLTGKKFGRLTVIQRDESKTRTSWFCKCECGKIISVQSSHLKNGHTKSCGCLQKEISANLMKNQIQKLGTESIINDLTNQVFGYLTAIEYAYSKNNKRFWKCKCKCGNETYVSTGDLITYHTNSCGCLKSSKGELKIEQLLNDNNIKYIREYSFEDCNYKRKLKFDFYIQDKYLIEFDGPQHYKSNNKFWDTEERFIEGQIRDKIKNNYCQINNIPLIRIPYFILKELTLEDLLLETTKYRVV